MIDARRDAIGFAPAHDAPIPYIQRIRDYYVALGYGAPYEWAHYAEVPFQPLRRPLAESRVAIVTTAAPYQPGKGDQGPGAPYNAAAKFYAIYSGDTSQDHDLRISHVAIDRKHTTATDQNGYFPLPELRAAAGRGRIGAVASRFHGLPTNRSHRTTLGTDCPELVSRCLADGVDAAILVPNCPVCHQSVSLAARMLEANGIATVIMGCAKDIVEYVGVPRLLFSDFPLGNALESRMTRPRRHSRSNWRWRCSSARPSPARRCNRHLFGALTPPGNSTIQTLRCCLPKRSPDGAPISTARRQWPKHCGKTWPGRRSLSGPAIKPFDGRAKTHTPAACPRIP